MSSKPEVIDVEPTTAALVPAGAASSALVRPVAEVSVVEAALAEYQQLCQRLLDPSDYQKIGSKDFPKKSAWRKLNVAFNVSTELVTLDETRDDRGRIIRARAVVRAIAPNGRHQDGVGICSVFEKCCAPGCRKDFRGHRHCAEDCPGTIHFSNAEHDVPATAHTRATNRACSDLYGMGEVSAEEVGQQAPPEPEADPQAWYRANGWTDQAEYLAWRKAILGGLHKLAPARQQTFKEWREQNGHPDFSQPHAKPQAQAMSERFAQLLAEADEQAEAELAQEATEAPQVVEAEGEWDDEEEAVS